MAKKQMNEFMVSSGLKTDTKTVLGNLRRLKKKIGEAEEMLDDVTEPAVPADIEDFGAEDGPTIDGAGDEGGPVDIQSLISDVENVLSQLQTLDGEEPYSPEGDTAGDVEIDLDMPADDDGDEFPVESKRKGKVSQINSHIAEAKAKVKAIPGLIERVTQDILREANNLDIRTSAKLGGSGDAGNVTFDGAGELNTRDVSNNSKVTQTPGSAGSQHDLDTPADKGPTFDGIPDVPKAGSSRFLQSNGGDLGSVAESRDNSTVRNPKAVAPGSYVVIYKRGTLEKVDSGIVHKVTSNSLTLEGDESYDMGSHDYRTLAT